MRKGGGIRKSSTRIQPEATANYKCLFFLDVGPMPAAIRDQHSVPHGKLLQRNKSNSFQVTTNLLNRENFKVAIAHLYHDIQVCNFSYS